MEQQRSHEPLTLAIVGQRGSAFGLRLAAAARARGAVCFCLSIDAPLEGAPVTVRPGAITWDGTELLSVGALLVETPLFPWPQPQRALATDDADDSQRLAAAEREARSLALSALRAVAEARPVWNSPATAHLAASPATALLRLRAADHPVAPWRVGPAPAPSESSETLVLDVVGRDRWHAPSRPPPGQPALMFEAIPGELVVALVAGGVVAGGRCFGAAESWAAEAAPPSAAAAPQPARVLDGPQLSPAAGDCALSAAAALGLEVAAVAMSSAGRIVLVDAAPDLGQWDEHFSGALAPLLAERLAVAATEVQP